MLKYIQTVFFNRSIEHELNAISFLYLKEIQKLNCVTQDKINIEAVQNLVEDYWITPLELSKKIITISVKYDVSTYVVSSNDKKLQMQLDIIDGAIRKVFEALLIDYKPLENLKQTILQLFGKMEIEIVRNEKIGARVIAIPKFDFFDYYLIYNTDEEIKRVFLFRGHTYYIFYTDTLFSKTIAKNGTITVRSKKGKVQFQCKTIDNAPCEIMFSDNLYSEILNKYMYKERYDTPSFVSYDI